MKAYMGYSRGAGAEEGACLIFAQNTKAARKLAHRHVGNWFGEGWIDTATRLLTHLPEHLKKLDDGTERAIECPPTCSNCLVWGGHPIEGGSGCDLCMTYDD